MWDIQTLEKLNREFETKLKTERAENMFRAEKEFEEARKTDTRGKD